MNSLNFGLELYPEFKPWVDEPNTKMQTKHRLWKGTGLK